MSEEEDTKPSLKTFAKASSYMVGAGLGYFAIIIRPSMQRVYDAEALKAGQVSQSVDALLTDGISRENLDDAMRGTLMLKSSSKGYESGGLGKLEETLQDLSNASKEITNGNADMAHKHAFLAKHHIIGFEEWQAERYQNAMDNSLIIGAPLLVIFGYLLAKEIYKNSVKHLIKSARDIIGLTREYRKQSRQHKSGQQVPGNDADGKSD